MDVLRTTHWSESVLAAVAALSVGCGKGDPKTARSNSQAVAIRAALVQVQTVVYHVHALGSLEAEEVMQVTAEVEGAVSEVHFNEGDRVGPETVLLSIDPERYRVAGEQAEATYKKSLADQHRAQDDWRRQEQLAEEKLVSESGLIRARQEAERLSADAASAKAAWDIALQNVRRASVRPPRAGVINTRAVDTGQFVKSGTTLATLVDTSRLRLRFKVSEAESLKAEVGQAVEFHVDSLGERKFGARIYHVSQVADAATRQVEVLAWVQNPGPLKPGFFAEVELATDARKSALVVPEGAVQASEKGFITYVVEGGRAHLRSIELGLRTGTGQVEILSGLKPGESVVVEGSDRLADGILVQEESRAPRENGG
jgi:membrane fusion protein (multidrug efflux system)